MQSVFSLYSYFIYSYFVLGQCFDWHWIFLERSDLNYLRSAIFLLLRCDFWQSSQYSSLNCLHLHPSHDPFISTFFKILCPRSAHLTLPKIWLYWKQQPIHLNWSTLNLIHYFDPFYLHFYCRIVFWLRRWRLSAQSYRVSYRFQIGLSTQYSIHTHMILPIYLLAKAPLISRLGLIGFLTRLLRFSLVKDFKLLQKGVQIDCLGAILNHVILVTNLINYHRFNCFDSRLEPQYVLSTSLNPSYSTKTLPHDLFRFSRFCASVSKQFHFGSLYMLCVMCTIYNLSRK